ncbi:MAG: Gfo/Idh/MocA family oxidoreductase, partial [Bacillota bacterium]
MKKKKIIVIGLGQWGNSWVVDIMAHPLFSLVAVIDNNQSQINKVIQKNKLDGSIGFTSYQSAIITVKPDVAVIAVPPKYHFAVVDHCLENHVDIISEKPLAVNIEEANKMLKKTNDNGVRFMVSQDYRWQPPIQTIRKAIKEGLIGKVGYITYRHFQNLQIGGWREQMKEVILEDMAIH